MVRWILLEGGGHAAMVERAGPVDVAEAGGCCHDRRPAGTSGFLVAMQHPGVTAVGHPCAGARRCAATTALRTNND
ncbi:hypothetical protein G6F32_016437 [Rhizopus arrhizus]|nr:hypothetical protein G6F32_016437 [Rhizopus arrhizus]